LTRISLTFRLSGESRQSDLAHEFELHEGVVTRASDADGQAVLIVETDDTEAAIWDIRATVGIFDEQAVEVPGPVADPPA
jgi:hypothetical protein